MGSTIYVKFVLFPPIAGKIYVSYIYSNNRSEENLNNSKLSFNLF